MARLVVVDIPTDFGSLIIGGLLAFCLSGCVSMQFIMYWQIYPEDRWTMKSLVITIWLLDLLHSTFIAVAIWDTVIVAYGDLDHADVIPWSVGPTVALTAMVTFLMHREVLLTLTGSTLLLILASFSFFAYRIYRLQNRKFLVAGPIFILALIKLGAATVSMAEMINLKCYSEFGQRFTSWVLTLGLSLSALVDIFITTSLCYFLRSNRSLVASTNHLIGVLTLWTVQNGTITCLGAITTLVCWLTMPHNRIFLGVYFVVGKLYANCLLATLNARNRIRSRKYNTTSHLPPTILQDTGFVDEHRGMHLRSPLPYVARLGPLSLQPVNLTRTRSIEISVQRTVQSKYDGADGDTLSVTVESVRETEESVPVPVPGVPS